MELTGCFPQRGAGHTSPHSLLSVRRQLPAGAGHTRVALSPSSSQLSLAFWGTDGHISPSYRHEELSLYSYENSVLRKYMLIWSQLFFFSYK